MDRDPALVEVHDAPYLHKASDVSSSLSDADDFGDFGAEDRNRDLDLDRDRSLGSDDSPLLPAEKGAMAKKAGKVKRLAELSVPSRDQASPMKSNRTEGLDGSDETDGVELSTARLPAISNFNQNI